jgi:hypothetical protein
MTDNRDLGKLRTAADVYHGAGPTTQFASRLRQECRFEPQQQSLKTREPILSRSGATN